MINFIEVNNEKVLYWLLQAESMNLSGNNPIRFRGFEQNDNYEEIRDYCLSKEYLDKRLENIDHCKIEYSCNKLIGETEGGGYLLDKLKTIIDYTEYYTSGCSPRGFVGWHSDSDITGYYISFVYQGETNGILKYRHPQTKEIIDFVNTPGWNVFAYKLGETINDTMWHASVSESDRYSFLIKFDTEEELNKAINVIGTK
jgi:hypothetical protein